MSELLVQAALDNLNESQRINKLPIELLSHIFMIGENVQRHARLTSPNYIGFQNLVAQVCQHWRNAAIQTLELWNYIFYSASSPLRFERIELYLGRSGTCPIHIDFDIRSKTDNFLDDAVVNQAFEVFIFSGLHWSKENRWGSIIVVSTVPMLLYNIINSLGSQPTPALRFISLRWNAHSGFQREERVHKTITSAGLPFVYPDFPQLRSVDLKALPCDYTFQRARLMLVNLTTLKVACASIPYAIEDISSVLSTCLQLESLSLDTGLAHVDIQASPGDLPRVFLPLMRSLSLRTLYSNEWIFYLLRVIDAPRVEDFEMSSFAQISRTEKLVNYLNAGRLNGLLQDTTPSIKQPGTGPIFPSLHHLSLDLMLDMALYAQIFEAYVMISKATLNMHGVIAICQPNPTLFHLTHLRCTGHEAMRHVAMIALTLGEGKNAGMRLKLFEFPSASSVPSRGQTDNELLRSFDGIADQVMLYNGLRHEPTRQRVYEVKEKFRGGL